MAEISGFHNSVNGDRRVKADFFARFLGSFIGNGVYPNPSTNLQVIANGDMTVTVKAGKAWVNGVFYENTADKVIQLDVADGVLKRIDRIVVSDITLERDTYSKVKKGSFASTPAAPALQRDADAYDLGLADIYIVNGAVSISQANITDLRLNSSYCGIVHGLFDQVDTETIFNQYLAWFEETKLKGEADFNAWLANLQYVLSGDVAGNLLNLINDNTDDIAVHTTAISSNSNSIITIDGRLEETETIIISLDSRLDNQERLLTSTITTSWIGTSAPFTQTIAISGITSSDKPVISPVFSTTLATAVLQKEAWNQISKIETGLNSITVTCFEDKPVTAIPIQIKGA